MFLIFIRADYQQYYELSPRREMKPTGRQLPILEIVHCRQETQGKEISKRHIKEYLPTEFSSLIQTLPMFRLPTINLNSANFPPYLQQNGP
jgi:hypothetical protein